MQNFFNKYKIIAGIDEAGRGPLAGPVTAAVVIGEEKDLNKIKKLKLNDSKKITPKKRAELSILIKKYFTYSISSVSEKTIDEINILNATLLAMRKALEKIPQTKNLILIDGNQTIPDFPVRQKAIPKGDTKISLIQAASILAKVERDNYLIKISEKYPGYNFQQHKGYGTKEHLLALGKLGPCEIHRRSFGPVRAFFKPLPPPF